MGVAGQPAKVEDAVLLTGSGLFHWALLVAAGMCSASAVHEIVSPSYLLPAAACDLDMDTPAKSLLSAMAFIGMVAGTHMWGVLSDRWGRLVVLRVTLLGDALVSVVASLLPNAALFTAARFFNGFLIGAPTSSAMAYLGEFHGEVGRARALVLVNLFPGAAAVTLAGLAYALLPLQGELWLWGLRLGSWRLFVLANAAPALLTGLALFWFPESPRFLAANGRTEEALASLRRAFTINTGKAPEEFPVSAILPPDPPAGALPGQDAGKQGSAIAAMWFQTVTLLKPPLLFVTSMVCIINFAVIGNANGVLVWLPEMFNRMAVLNNSATVCEAPRLEAETTTTTTVCSPKLNDEMFINTAFIGVANLVCCVLGVFLVGWIGKKLLLGLGLLVAGVCALMFTFMKSQVGLLVLACGLIGITNMCIGVVTSINVDNVPTSVRASAVSLMMTAGRCGSMTGSYVTGMLLDSYCNPLFWGLGAFLVACGCLGLLLPTKGAHAK